MNTDAVDKVSEIIGVLCEKLGTTAQYLIPELARMYIVTGIFDVIMWGAITLVSGFLAFVMYKKYREDEDEVERFIISVCLGGVAVVGFIVFAVCGDELVGWLASPKAKAVLKILESMKG